MNSVYSASLFTLRRRMSPAKWTATLAFSALCALGALSIAPTVVFAGPGAHGPDGQHLDAPVAGAGAAGAAPRVEAKTDLFELVGQLRGGEFSIFIDRFATNAPLLNAKVEVESGSLKAVAKFLDDNGNYAIEDVAFLKALSAPGAHPLVFTVVAGEESDLLDGTLTVSSELESQSHSHSHGQTYFGLSRFAALGIAIGTLALLIVGGLFFRSRMRRNVTRPHAGSRS